MLSGFFNSSVLDNDGQGNPIYDRYYDADFLTTLIKAIVPNGVTSGSFVPSRGDEAMTVKIGAGQCFINGCFGFNLSDSIVTIPASSSSRTDLIVLRLDNSARTISLERKQGSSDLTRTSTVYEMALASVFVEGGSSILGEGAVVDLRYDGDKCSVISSVGGGGGDFGIFSLPVNFSDTMQNRLVVRGADGLISGSVENSQKLCGRRIFVQSGQPAAASANDLWFW